MMSQSQPTAEQLAVRARLGAMVELADRACAALNAGDTAAALEQVGRVRGELEDLLAQRLGLDQ